jgi:hypothetical protein
VIGFGIGILVMLVFSAIIYAIAYAVRLDPAAVRGHVDASAREAEVEEAELGL